MSFTEPFPISKSALPTPNSLAAPAHPPWLAQAAPAHPPWSLDAGPPIAPPVAPPPPPGEPSSWISGDEAVTTGQIQALQAVAGDVLVRFEHGEKLINLGASMDPSVPAHNLGAGMDPSVPAHNLSAGMDITAVPA